MVGDRLPLIFSADIQSRSLNLMRVGTSYLAILLIALFGLPCSLCALNQTVDTAIRDAIKAAVADGLSKTDSFLRKEYWQYLKEAQISLYNVTILSHSLNYKIIYLNKKSIFRANCNIDKITWEPFLNSFVKLPTFLVDKVNSSKYYDLFLLNNGVADIAIQRTQQTKQSSGSGFLPTDSTLHDLTPAKPSPVGIITINQTFVSSASRSQHQTFLRTQPTN